MEEKIIQNICETKRWMFEKFNKIDKPLARLIRSKRNSLRAQKSGRQDFLSHRYHFDLLPNNNVLSPHSSQGQVQHDHDNNTGVYAYVLFAQSAKR